MPYTKTSLLNLFNLRKLAALLLFLLALFILLSQGWTQVTGDPRVQDAFLGGLVAALATGLGTLPVLLSKTIPQKLQDSMNGFGAGVMLAACSFSLIIPGLKLAGENGASSWEASGIIGGGIALGGLLLLLFDRLTPHEHFIKGVEGQQAIVLKRTWLFVFAIILHNLPEGLAIGVAFGGTDAYQATALTTGIAIQDIPEGLVVAVALRGAGYGRLFAIGLGILSGLIEPVGSVVGASIITISTFLLPWGLAFAAGAMLFVISHEIIPESHRQGHEAYATGGLMLGFILMMVLDTALG